ncbi:hypothetical protein SAMN05421844_107214 [Bosea robiniae]|uniref:Uncharacterized protein n=1 Tax=Bosea robiniae TaxID=1036780 RepID=A0ABY0P479_9HYPH|nr:hypothetical protein SAMN05421844_107214 [Bosea robiniae]
MRLMQAQLQFDEEEDRARRNQRAFARLWVGCRDVSRRKGYALDVSEKHWKQAERETR